MKQPDKELSTFTSYVFCWKYFQILAGHKLTISNWPPRRYNEDGTFVHRKVHFPLNQESNLILILWLCDVWVSLTGQTFLLPFPKPPSHF